MPQKNLPTIPDEVILNKIYYIRNLKVMIDRDLAELYGVETRVLKQSVKRNISRFPTDFMFQMSKEELENWRSQFVTSNRDKAGLRHLPFCFTEQGVTMLSCVLKSKRAIDVNIRIIRVFSKMREVLSAHKDVLLRLEQLERNLVHNSEDIQMIFDVLKQLVNPPQLPREEIGFKIPGKK